MTEPNADRGPVAKSIAPCSLVADPAGSSFGGECDVQRRLPGRLPLFTLEIEMSASCDLTTYVALF